jgi:hypothetical protein
MIAKQTVFVLGAGASKPFGFPTGRELRDRVIAELHPRNVLFQRVERFGKLTAERITQFRDAFRDSARTSVDAFLEHRQEFMEVGKAVIATALIEKETSDVLFNDAGDWTGYLWDHLYYTVHAPTHATSNVSFITYNYDRSLEHFLFTATKNAYGKSDADCALALRKIPIMHLHGRLGYLPWQSETDARPYNTELDKDSLGVAVRGIKIVHEDLSAGRNEDFELAKRLLREAERIYFLGFGYGRTNMDRLSLKQLSCPALGTGFGLTASEISYVRKLVASKISVSDFACMPFLRNVVEWD